MILNWENKPDLKNHKDFSKETLVNSLNFFFNSNKNNLLINSENNSAISSIINSKALEKIKIDPSSFGGKKASKQPVLSILKRPEVKLEDIYKHLKRALPEKGVLLDIETKKKYAGYIERQNKEIQKIQKYENAKIPEEIIFSNIVGLSNEVKQKLEKVLPKTIAHAQRIPGITPAAISLLLVHIKKEQSLPKKRIES